MTSKNLKACICKGCKESFMPKGDNWTKYCPKCCEILFPYIPTITHGTR